jgi:hypothetical protein
MSASEDALLQTRKRILAVDQEARNEIHRQEALFWKVKREIMVAEALAKGIKLPASITNLDAGAPSRLFNGDLDVILQNIQKTETVIFCYTLPFPDISLIGTYPVTSLSYIDKICKYGSNCNRTALLQ